MSDPAEQKRCEAEAKKLEAEAQLLVTQRKHWWAAYVTPLITSVIVAAVTTFGVIALRKTELSELQKDIDKSRSQLAELRTQIDAIAERSKHDIVRAHATAQSLEIIGSKVGFENKVYQTYLEANHTYWKTLYETIPIDERLRIERELSR